MPKMTAGLYIHTWFVMSKSNILKTYMFTAKRTNNKCFSHFHKQYALCPKTQFNYRVSDRFLYLQPIANAFQRFWKKKYNFQHVQHVQHNFTWFLWFPHVLCTFCDFDILSTTFLVFSNIFVHFYSFSYFSRFSVVSRDFSHMRMFFIKLHDFHVFLWFFVVFSWKSNKS